MGFRVLMDVGKEREITFFLILPVRIQNRVILCGIYLSTDNAGSKEK